MASRLRRHGPRTTRTSIHHLDDGFVKDEIFTKLPLSTQWAARSVCKQWRTLLMEAKARAPEDYIVVNLIHTIVFYNVKEARWMQPRPLQSIPLPFQELKEPSLCTVCDEFIFFRDKSTPPRIAMWNVITNESRILHELDPVPGDEEDGILEFGAYINKATGDLTFMVYNYFDYPDGDLHVWDKHHSWRNPKPPAGDCHGPNYNFLNGIVTFLDSGPILVQVYEVEKNRFNAVAWIEVKERRPEEEQEEIDPARFLPGSLAKWLETHIFEPHEMYDWDTTHFGARFYFEGLGVYVIGSMKIHVETAGDKDLGVLWFNPSKKEMELVSESPDDMIYDMYEEGYHSRLLYCSDGVENIFIVAPGSSRMARFNVVSRNWYVLPSILNQFPECEVEMTRGALYARL